MPLGSVCSRAALVALLFGAGCGGSSSESPPPLEPDPEGFRYTGSRLPLPADESESRDEEREDEADAADEKPRRKPPASDKQAPSTWGRSDTSSAPKRPELK